MVVQIGRVVIFSATLCAFEVNGNEFRMLSFKVRDHDSVVENSALRAKFAFVNSC